MKYEMQDEGTWTRKTFETSFAAVPTQSSRGPDMHIPVPVWLIMDGFSMYCKQPIEDAASADEITWKWIDLVAERVAERTTDVISLSPKLRATNADMKENAGSVRTFSVDVIARMKEKEKNCRRAQLNDEEDFTALLGLLKPDLFLPGSSMFTLLGGQYTAPEAEPDDDDAGKQSESDDGDDDDYEEEGKKKRKKTQKAKSKAKSKAKTKAKAKAKATASAGDEGPDKEKLTWEQYAKNNLSTAASPPAKQKKGLEAYASKNSVWIPGLTVFNGMPTKVTLKAIDDFNASLFGDIMVSKHDSLGNPVGKGVALQRLFLRFYQNTVAEVNHQFWTFSDKGRENRLTMVSEWVPRDVFPGGRDAPPCKWLPLYPKRNEGETKEQWLVCFFETIVYVFCSFHYIYSARFFIFTSL
jgi:hypothetical protein